MNVKDIFKKYWFVLLIGVVLIAFIGVYIVNENKNKEVMVEAKQVDGKDVVYSVDGQDVYADDFYEALYNQNGLQTAYVQFQRAILNAFEETSEDMETIASNYAAYMYQYYGQEYMESALRQMGYTNGIDDLNQYYVDAQKQNDLVKEYVTNHFDENKEAFLEETNGRMVYHILIKVADITSSTDDNGDTIYTANPTEEEQAKLDAVLAALETRDFLDVQAEYNEDGANDPYFVDNDNTGSFYDIFNSTSLALEDGEVSQVVVSSAGYHIIKSYGADNELLLNDSNFLSAYQDFDELVNLKSVMDKAEELGYSIVNEELLNVVNAQLGSEDEE